MRLPGVEQHSVSSDSLESGVIAGRGVVRAWTMEISIGQGIEEPWKLLNGEKQDGSSLLEWDVGMHWQGES